MKVFVVGGTGTVGRFVVDGLTRKGMEVACLVRNGEKARALPEGVEGKMGDLDGPETLPELFRGNDAAFLLFALSRNETKQGLAAVEAAGMAGLKKLVYMSVMMPENSKHIPHFRSKIPIEEAVKASGISYTILRPNMFFQNTLQAKEPILTFGVYPFPIGSIGVSQVDVRDIADAAVNALITPGHDNAEYSVCGPEALTGDDAAGILSRHMGRDVVAMGDALNVWANQAKQSMPPWMIEDLKVMFRYFQKKASFHSLLLDYGFSFETPIIANALADCL